MRSLLVDRRPLAVPAFRQLWTATAVAAVGGSFAQVAVPAELFTRTGSSAAVAAAAAVSLAALIVAALWAGARADAVDRRRVLLAGHCGLAATYALLWLRSGTGSVALLLVLVAAQAGCLGAVMATMGAVIPRLVPTDLLPAANTLGSLVRYAGAILGPLIAGLLIPITGLGTLYLLDAVALLAVIRAVRRLPPIPPAPSTATRPGVISGFRYLFGHRLLVAVLGIDLAATVFGFPGAVFPELAERVYGGPPSGGFELGLLYAAVPAGVFTAGLLSGTFTRAHRHGLLLAAGTAVWGLCVAMLAIAPTAWWAAAALTAGGSALLILSTFRTAITQDHTDDAMRGRIQGALTVVTVGGPSIAGVLHGVAAELVGPRWAVGGGGLLTTVAVMTIVVAYPPLTVYRAPGYRAPGAHAG